MEYAEARALYNEVKETSKSASVAIRAFPKDGPFGMTSDAVRATPEWKAAKSAMDTAFAHEQQIASWFCKTFKKEYATERAARYA